MFSIILSGPPGSGKGTQSELICEHYGLHHVSTGDLLRNELKNKTTLGRKIESIMTKGELIDDETVTAILENHINQCKDTCKGFVFDGYPRSLNQAQVLNEKLKQWHLKAVMFDICVDEAKLTERLLLRGQTSGRSDDNMETIKQRIDIYKRTTAPVSLFYAQQSLYYAINGNFSIKETFDQIQRIADLLSK